MIIHHTERHDAAQNGRTVSSTSRDMTIELCLLALSNTKHIQRRFWICYKARSRTDV